ncbi:unnamed protein product [Debaryomyces tyrocola]|nr:unnamed protein product [Debaryomyces tyrocola]
MSKRSSEDGSHQTDKKLKGDDKKDEIAIDSELLGQQSSYTNNGPDDSRGDNHGGNNDNNVNAAAAAAVAAAAASEPANAAAAALSSQQQHHSQQLQQHLAYQNAFRQQQQVQQQQVQQQHHQHHQHGHHSQHPSHSPQNSLSHLQPTTLPQTSSTSKPQHGSDEWHKQRRENHKEVERRRRESINQGIKELAALIPTNDTNKAQILQRAVEYIKRLKENENNNIEKWTLEKLLTEQAVSELSASNDKLKQELERAYREIEQWKKLVKDEKNMK